MRFSRLALALAATIVLAAPAIAQMPSLSGMPGMGGMGMPFKDILGRASDQALDKLSQPGAFQADDAIRIGLPGPAKGLGGVMGLAGKAGVGGGLTDGLNTAAGPRPVKRQARPSRSSIPPSTR